MSSVKVFDYEKSQNILSNAILEVPSVNIFAINQCAAFCKRSTFGFVNDICSANKLLFLPPVVHFARFQKFFSDKEIRQIKKLIDKLE